MRISRPDGISQENRSHPFFILLRKFADEQAEVTTTASRMYIRYLIVMLIALIAAGIASVTIFIQVFPMVVLAAISIYLPDIYRYKEFKRLLNDTCFAEVERMIFSNDYQLSHLNMESTINTMVKCTRVTGAINQIMNEVRSSIYASILFMMGIAIAILYKVVCYGV